MKKNILFFIYIFVSLASVAQNNIGIGTNTPNPNAKLDISSTTKGLLIPRMSSAQRITLAGTLGLSDEGLMVYDTDLQKFYYWDKNIGFSGNWNQVRPGSLSYGKIWIGDATNTAVERSMSGDVTISDTGLATIQPNAVQGTDISLAGETTGNIMQFNGTDWVPVDPSTLTVRNIYTANGTLTGNRTMTMAANSLNLNATNGNFIYNPSGTGKMGIGGTPSTYKLEVIGSDASINNVRVGLGAGNIAGNTVVGSGALNANTSGFVNTAIGYTALAANTTGADNTAIGMDGMLYNTSGSMNTSIGTYALVNNTTGNYNSGIGKNALYTNSTGSNNTALGYNADVSTGALTNATAIGSGAIVSASNSLVLGNGANVGIGISNPTNKLEVVGNTKTSNFQMTTGATNNFVLKSDASGNGAWVDPSSLTVSNIYTANGTLTGARTVTQGANTLAFTSTATNGFSVDGSTFSVDAANNRIGIGTTAPKNDLQIGQGGDPMIRIDGALNTSAAGHLRFSETYTSDYGFDIAHNSSTDELIFKGLSAGVASPDNLLVLKRFPTIGVGIGASPTGAGMLEVSGNTKTTNFQMTSGATNNFVLKSDASGNGAWVNPNTLAVTNTLTNPTNTITSTVNGVSATAPAVNTVSNTSSTNTLSTTVNGVAGTGVNIINSNALTSATNTMTSTINGVASNAPIVNSNTKTWTQAGGMSDVVNGVSANVTPASGTINNVLGYDATGAPVYQSSTALSVSNIYTANGTLTGARTVTQGANTLAFTSTATNGFSVDGTTFSVDAANDRVGIGTTTPAALLDIAKNGTDGGTWYGEKIYRAGNNTSTGYGLNVASEVFSGGGTGGNYYGVYSTAQWGNNNYGVYGKGLYGITGSYGLYGDATSSGATTNYGVYGTAANATNNWAGYFVGNGYFSGNLGIGTTTPTTQLHTTGTVRFANYTNGFLVGDATGTLTAPRSIAVSGTGIDIANGNGVAGNPTLSLNYGPTMAVASNGKYPVGNFGQFEPHGTYTDFNVTPNFWGWNYVQGNTNAPNTVSSQWYRQNISLGSNFAGRGAGGYSLELAYPRDRTAGAGFWSRTVENGVIGNWSRLDGFAHNVSSSLHPSMDDITGWTTLTGACTDDAAYTVNWGFPFNIDGVNYTSGWISTNGILGFGGSTTTSYSNTALPTSLSNDPMLFFHWDDNSTDIIRYVVQGTAPNRNCFIQWSGSETLFCTTGGSKIMAYITLSEGSNVVSVRYLAQGSAADAQGAGATFGFQYAGGASAGSIPLGYNTKLLDDNATNQQFSIDF